MHHADLVVAELLRNALLPSSQPDAPSPCPPPVSLVCLGLGSVADSRKSQEQFILLQELVAEIGDAVRGLLGSLFASQAQTFPLPLFSYRLRRPSTTLSLLRRTTSTS